MKDRRIAGYKEALNWLAISNQVNLFGAAIHKAANHQITLWNMRSNRYAIDLTYS